MTQFGAVSPHPDVFNVTVRCSVCGVIGSMVPFRSIAKFIAYVAEDCIRAGHVLTVARP